MADWMPNPFLAGIEVIPKCIACGERLLDGKCWVPAFLIGGYPNTYD